MTNHLTSLIRKAFAGLIVGLALVALGQAAPAAATGEVYYLGSSTAATTIIGEGGIYKAPATFSLSTEVGDSQTFSTSLTTTCANGSSLSSSIKLGISKTNLGITAAGGASSTGSVTPDASLAACAGPMDSVAIVAQTKATAATASTAPPGSANTDGVQIKCDSGPFSWVFCPLYEWLLNTVNTLEKDYILPLLQVTPIAANAANPAYAIWNAVRGLSTGLFVIAFLVMIFSTTTSFGIDSYSLKRTLPRLIAAAIGVQFSFALVGLAVDISNIVGYGLGQLMLAPLAGQNVAVVTNLTSGLGIGAAIAGALSLAGGILSGGILVILIGAFFAILGAFFTLVTRQILITMLLVLSPLAFAAAVLPNTESYFKAWHRLLSRLLIMYPLVVALIYSGRVFGAITAATPGSGAQSELRSLISIVANVAPLFFIPATFKYAGAALGAIGGLVATLHGGVAKKSLDSDSYQRLKHRTQQRRTELAAGQQVRGAGWLMGSNAGASAVSLVARGGKPSGMSAANNARALADFVKEKSEWSKRLNEEGMTYEGFQALSRGSQWTKNKLTDVDTDIATTNADLSTARASGNMALISQSQARYDSLMETRNRYEMAHVESGRYMKSNAARAAALGWLADKDLLEDSDLSAIGSYTPPTKTGGLIARQVWGQAKEGARKTNVHLAFTDVKGVLDVQGMEKFVAKKNQSAWAEYSKDAIEVMRDKGILDNLAADRAMAATLASVLSSKSGPSIGAPQQNIIRDALTRNGNGGLI